MLYDNSWAIRLIAALLLTFMSHIRPVPSSQGGYSRLSPRKQCSKPPPNWNMKTINCKLVQFCQFLQCQGINRETKTHSSHNVGWLSPRYYVATTPVRMEITGGWYSRGVSNLCRKLESDQYGKCSHRWHWQLAREPCFVLFWWWTGSTVLSGLKVHVLNKMLWAFTTSARTRSKAFLAKPMF